jgi:hypothetical protein
MRHALWRWERNAHILFGNFKERDRFEDQDIDSKIILK